MEDTHEIRELNSAETLDIPMSRKVLEHLIAHPEEHSQKFYGAQSACGARACIAGTTVLMDSATTVSWDGEGMSSFVWVDNRCFDIDHRAAQLLGLRADDATRLFHDYDNTSALTQLADHIAAAEKAQA